MNGMFDSCTVSFDLIATEVVSKVVTSLSEINHRL